MHPTIISLELKPAPQPGLQYPILVHNPEVDLYREVVLCQMMGLPHLMITRGGSVMEERTEAARSAYPRLRMNTQAFDLARPLAAKISLFRELWAAVP